MFGLWSALLYSQLVIVTVTSIVYLLTLFDCLSAVFDPQILLQCLKESFVYWMLKVRAKFSQELSFSTARGVVEEICNGAIGFSDPTVTDNSSLPRRSDIIVRADANNALRFQEIPYLPLLEHKPYIYL